MKNYFNKSTSLMIEMIGFLFFIFTWYSLPTFGFVSPMMLPTPLTVISSIQDMYQNNKLIMNIMYSIKLNIYGYIEALTISITLGFIIGLTPFLKCLTERYIAASRYLPLPAMMGLFIAWFGIDTKMKVQFLTVGIIVYLLPVVIQRVSEVEDIYIQTVQTLGASKWKIIKHVYIPSVLSKLSVDIRVLTAIGWTYITVIELVNKTYGLGALAHSAARESRIDKVYAVLIIIMLIGFIQDKLFCLLDRIIFRYKYKDSK